jgi:hypothetical protein
MGLEEYRSPGRVPLAGDVWIRKTRAEGTRNQGSESWSARRGRPSRSQ